MFAVGSFFFVSNIDLKIIVGFYFLNGFLQSRLISMGVIFIRAIMFVSDLASFEGGIFFVQNMPVMFGIF